MRDSTNSAPRLIRSVLCESRGTGEFFDMSSYLNDTASQ